VRWLNVTPHVAQKEHTALDARTTRDSGYGVSQRFRKRVEEAFMAGPSWPWARPD